MSAANFYKENARNYYVLDGRSYWRENEDGELEELEGWEEDCQVDDQTEDEIEFIRERSGAYANKYACYGRWYVPQNEYERRSGDCLLVCRKQEHIELSPYCGIGITTNIIFRPGYYEAGNLDWYISVSDDHGSSFDGEYDPDDVDELALDVLDYISWREEKWNAGLIKMQAKNIAKKVKDEFERAQEEADEFCRKNCTGVYGLAYRFSNGEAGYIKIN